MKLASPHDRASAVIDRKVNILDYSNVGKHAFRGFQMGAALVDGALKKGANGPLSQLVMQSAKSYAQAGRKAA